GVGDAVVIEIQCSGAAPGPYPCEYVPSVYAVVENATAAGIHVFAAAGNGSRNLDSSVYGGLFDRNVRDSGSVMVGASNGSSLNTASFSNFGSRVDAHGWGFQVTTAGYGDLQGGPETEEYTAQFSGTSSATPIVTGAGMILASIHESAYGTHLEPLALREALVATGTPQGSGGLIGPRPNLRAAIPYLNLPRIDLEGELTIGSEYTITQNGRPGDLQVIAFSPRTPLNPHFHNIYGDLFLDRPIMRVNASILDSNGEATFTASIPDDAALVGMTIGYYQGWQRFETDPGTGTFTNFVQVSVQ
ncbi:MAG: S8 family serine peptidase, partial [Planctomycetota bacterium]